MTRDKFLTRAWNNQLTLLLGLPTLAWGVVALTTPVFSDLTAFIGMVVFAAVMNHFKPFLAMKCHV